MSLLQLTLLWLLFDLSGLTKDWRRATKMLNLLKSTRKIGPIPSSPLMSGCKDTWERHQTFPLPTSRMTLWLSSMILSHPPHGPARLMSSIIGYAPHGDAVNNYLTDNVKFWEKISNLTCSHECWTYVCPAQQKRNGHLAYMVLKNHYLGPNNMNHQANEAETKLKDSSYHGER